MQHNFSDYSPVLQLTEQLSIAFLDVLPVMLKTKDWDLPMCFLPIVYAHIQHVHISIIVLNQLSRYLSLQHIHITSSTVLSKSCHPFMISVTSFMAVVQIFVQFHPINLEEKRHCSCKISGPHLLSQSECSTTYVTVVTCCIFCDLFKYSHTLYEKIVSNDTFCTCL